MLIGHYNVSREMVLSGAEASEMYKGFDSRDTDYWALTYSDRTPTPRRNGSLDSYMMRGAREVLMRKYGWEDSHTVGGYVVHIILRLLRTRNGSDYSSYGREDTIEFVRSILKRFNTKYYIAANTRLAIQRHVYGELGMDVYVF